MNRRDAVLAGLAAAGEGANFTPVQVQKLFFLLDREAARALDGPHFAFGPYDYGPFDRAVYDVLEDLAEDGFLVIDNSRRYRRYWLTVRGYHHGRAALRDLRAGTRDYLERAANWVRRLRFDQLVAAIYKRYPDMKVNSVFRE